MKMKCVIAAITLVVAFAGSIVEARQFSKLALITAAEQIGKWPAIKSWISAAGFEDKWLAAAYLSDENPAFATVTNAVVLSGVLTAEEASTIIEASIDTAPDALLRGMYERDTKTEAGRVKWHGKRIAAPVVDPSNWTQKTTYEDGKVFIDKAKIKTPAEEVQQSNARLKRTVTTNGVPKILAEARLQQLKNKEPIEVTVNYVAGSGVVK